MTFLWHFGDRWRARRRQPILLVGAGAGARLNGAVLKTAGPERVSWVRIPPCPLQNPKPRELHRLYETGSSADTPAGRLQSSAAATPPSGGWPQWAPAEGRGRSRATRPRLRNPPCAACHGGGWHTSQSTAWRRGPCRGCARGSGPGTPVGDRTVRSRTVDRPRLKLLSAYGARLE